MQSDEGRQSFRRQIRVEVDAMQVHEVGVHRGGRNEPPHRRIYGSPRRRIDIAAGAGDRQQTAGGERAFACHDSRMMPCGDQRLVQRL